MNKLEDEMLKCFAVDPLLLNSEAPPMTCTEAKLKGWGKSPLEEYLPIWKSQQK